MKVSNYVMALALGCGSALWLTTGCTPQSERKEVEPVAVTLYYPTPTMAHQPLRYVGVVEAEQVVNLSFKVGGYVERVSVQSGMQVAKGALLATLSSEALEQSYQAAQAKLWQAQDAMRRMQELYDKESLPEIKYVEIKSQLEQAEAAYKVAEQNRKDTQLYAPQAGYIGAKGIEAGENVLPGQPLFSLLQLDQVKVKIAVPEQEIAQLALQQQATVEVGALGKSQFTGYLTEKGVVADRMAHTYEVRLTLPNPQKELLPGMVCQVTLPVASTAVSAATSGPTSTVAAPVSWLLPNRAIQVANDNRTYVWGVEQGVATRCYVTVGSLTPQGVLVTSGLKEGVAVVVAGMQKVSEGVNVREL